ncbi:uncharacterized protein A1O5_00992 [Cladophialophora psammophila CBS 110553]|uniref:Xylanolytic transcriptional activator regulatory domain-containing protein n=1 Tax=Cladophialophora psammophila CBS 110553 TaxID=1182543 RepID=W9Y1Z3_9EURO|nr:uncharacterized protein A1O5_00992 [Cladophialophora psammophila CBS 110553]EXJ76484.1 hypothetical protein A1O5_00992 [Cladophialophora psammophila CBS 110553]
MQQTKDGEGVARPHSRSWADHGASDCFDLSHLEPEDGGLQQGPALSSLSDTERQDQTPTSNATSGEDGLFLHSDPINLGQPLQTRENPVCSFLFDSAQLKYDSTTGQLRYFTPLVGYQLYADQLAGPHRNSAGSWHLQRRLHHMIKDLNAEAYDHLMTCFWTHYNNALQIVDQATFQQDRDGDKLHYSGFLHVCCLAMGFRYADRSRPDIKALDRGNRHSTFHESARYMVETELENPRGLTTVQGLLILSDLECAVGRDRSGWMYAGVACRFAFDMGLTIDHSKSTLPQQEIRSRQRLLRACVFYDRIWAIFSGHPTVIKRSDLCMAEFSPAYSTLISSISESSTRLAESPTETEAWEALLGVMELAIKVSSYAGNAAPTAGSDDGTTKFMEAAALHGELESWQRKLPHQLKWNSENMQNSPAMFFFIHQLFHSTLIQLHRSLVENQKPQLYEGAEQIPAFETTSPFQTLSKGICLENATTIVRIMDAYCTRFGMQSVSVFSPQPVSVALTALLANLSELGYSPQTATILQHVHTLSKVLQKWSLSYQTAQNMCTVLDHILPQTRRDVSNRTELGYCDGSLQGLPQQSSLQPPPQRGLEEVTCLEQWPPFQGNSIIATKDAITVARFDISRPTANRDLHGDMSI